MKQEVFRIFECQVRLLSGVPFKYHKHLAAIHASNSGERASETHFAFSFTDAIQRDTNEHI